MNDLYRRTESNPSVTSVLSLVGAAVVATGAVWLGTWYFRSGFAYRGVTLQLGSSGDAVKVLKSRLTEHGYGPSPGEETNGFGNETDAAVKRFQAAMGLTANGVVDGPTWSLLISRPLRGKTKYSPDRLARAMKREGYVVDTTGGWNIVGIRANTGSTNTFDDELHIFRRVNGKWDHHAYAITTDPGTYYLNQPLNVNGTSAIAPGQYPNSHGFGLHRGSYEALVQKGTIRAYRDNDKDSTYNFDPNSIVSCTGCGLNIHKASTNSVVVDRFSAGCQVFARSADFDEFMRLMKTSGQSLFTYTLMTAREV